MKTFLVIIFFAVAMLAASLAFVRGDRRPIAEKSFALVELFTSEGCSSCPSADELTAKIQRESNGKPVYVLAYHVDYWDRLGWKDSFSSPLWSQRQRQYASWMKKGNVYTPQVVVNGKTEFVGSDERSFRKALQQALSSKSPELILSVKQFTATSALIYTGYSPAKGTALYLACVQKAASIRVSRGENAGRTLSHTNIVRSLQQVVPAKAQVSIKLPTGFDSSSWEIIGFVQDTGSGAIISASRIALMDASAKI
ncbi:DUF1223 domain-containing protein [Daejeonella sp.]|uniref:DUF1223 domain-containing protein n=1 Tax=Daejeonella sp. TaxID=2805397 RepID=UPI0030BD576F